MVPAASLSCRDAWLRGGVAKLADGTKVLPFPKDFMDAGYKASMEVFAENEAKSPMFKKIHAHMRAFQRDQILWDRYSEQRFSLYMSSVKL